MKKQSIIKYILSFLIPFFILILFCISRKIGIFGKYSLLVSDFQAQYIALLKYLREFGSLSYSFSKGMGGGMIGTFAYYLSSPLNILIYLFPENQIVLASIFLIVLRISLSGLTMYTYLSNHFKEKKYSFLIFSSCYALMAYVVNYHFHIMWLDGVMLLPLVMMGIDKLFEKKSLLYIVSLFLATFSNYYIGYMICIMSVLYFACNLCLKYSLKKDKKEIISLIIRFFVSSLLSGMMTMILMIPNILELKNGYKSNIDITYSGFNLNFLNFWSRTYISSHSYENLLANDVISIYCGLIVLPLVYFYFIHKKIKKKEKIIYGCLFLILISGFFINAINMIFHGFNTANCFNYRFSFLISFVLILMACKSFLKIKEIPKYHYLLFYAVYLILSLMMFLKNYNYLSMMNIYISCTLIGIYLLLLYQYNRYSKNNDFKLLLFVIVFAELLFNLFMSLEKFDYYQTEEFDYYTNTMKKEIYPLQEENPEYRLSTQIFSSYNDSFLMNYHGINGFLSTVDINYLIFLHNAGYFYTTMSAIDYGNNTVLMDSLLGIKYRIIDSNKWLYQKVNTIEYPTFSGLLFHKDILSTAYIYENPYALPIGYMISTNYEEKNEIENVFEFQNYLLNNMLGNNTKYFKRYEKKKISEGAYEFVIDNDEYIYIYYDFESAIDACNILINGNQVTTRSEVFVYNSNLKGETIRVSLDGEVTSYGEAYAYYFDEEAFINDIKILQEHEMEFEIVKDGYIKGSANVTEDFNRVFFTIPYENGWTLYVDGKETEIDVMYSAFMGATLSEGEHTIELKYSVPGLKLGGVISGLSFVCTLVYLYFERKTRKEKEISLKKH